MSFQAWSPPFVDADFEPLPGNAVVSIAVKPITNDAGIVTERQLYFKLSGDGEEWPSDEDALYIDTLRFSRTAQLLSVGLAVVKIIAAHANQMWVSQDTGRTWTIS